MLQFNQKNIDKSLDGMGERVVVLFYANWCPFCRRFKSVFESWAGKSGVKFAMAEVAEDDNPMWDSFGVEVIPTIVAFRGHKELARRNGKAGIGLSEDDLKSLLEQISA